MLLRIENFDIMSCASPCCYYEQGHSWPSAHYSQHEQQEDEFIDVEGEVAEEPAPSPAARREADHNIFSMHAWEEWRRLDFHGSQRQQHEDYFSPEDTHPAPLSSQPLDLTFKISPPYSPPEPYYPPHTPYYHQEAPLHPFHAPVSPPILQPPYSPVERVLPPLPPSPQKSEFTAFGRRRWFTCEVCLQVFDKKYLMTQHLLTEHPGANNLIRCPHCAYFCKSKTTLSKHLAKEHAPKNLQCPHCPDTFSMLWSLNEHVNKIHRYYRCRHCHRAVGDLNSLVHHEEERECLQCGQDFSCVWLYSKHWQEHPVRVKCLICAASFKMPSSLEHHMRSVHQTHI